MDPLEVVLRQQLQAPEGPWQPTALRHAAVLCPLQVLAAEDHLVFVVRSTSLRQHQGQIGFPGGMREGDESPIDCALRECEEEIGIPASTVQVFGSLPPRESSSGILVHCLVGRIPALPLQTDPREVARVLQIPLRDLLDASRWQERQPPSTATGRQPRSSPHFDFDGELLWGLTARFVRDLALALQSGR
ncbi:MAG: CoA pyrophosphatase [Planctomycetes bacterium]|nr:CoA pyrophosphatase [Planctomycetota bacterium]